jgi:hypothetical protein
LLGYLIDHSGYVVAFQVIAAISLVTTLILGMLLWRSERDHNRLLPSI